jgi:hypothetical protein
MDKDCKIAALIVASLKAMALIHVQNHWLSKGSNFYGQHLLFERLYNSTLKDLDLAAEKFVGLFGEQVLSYDLRTELLGRVLSRYSALEGSPTQRSLAVEKAVLSLLQSATNAFQRSGVETLGLTDALGEIASHREEATYLLQQVLADK